MTLRDSPRGWLRPALSVAAVFLLVAGAWWAFTIWQPGAPRAVVMATGPERSAYASLGARHREILARSGVDLRLRPTAGAGIVFGSSQAAGSLVHISSAGGDDILTFKPVKAYQTVVLSSPLLTRAPGYSLYVGGYSSGTGKDGLYSGGTYSGGTRKATFDITGTLTVVQAN